jgi:hypothetical protein
MARVAALAVLAALAVAAPAQAADDQVVITGSVEVARGETANTIVVADGPVRVAGHVEGDVVVFSGSITVSGRVDGSVVGFEGQTRLLDGARVGEDVRYGDEEPIIAEGARVGGDVTKEDWEDVSSLGWLFAVGLWLAVTVSALALGLVMVWLFPRALEATWSAAQSSLGAVIAMGVGLFLGLPIAALLVAVTVFGLPLAIGLFLALLPLGALAYVTSAWLLGRRILGPGRGRVVALLLGMGILRAIALIPVLGGLVGLLATAFGAGALGMAAWRAGAEGRRPSAGAAGPGPSAPAAPPATS